MVAADEIDVAVEADVGADEDEDKDLSGDEGLQWLREEVQKLPVTTDYPQV
jgi:hypothetical protein